MNALVEYGSSSSNESDDDHNVINEPHKDEKPKLPKPALGESSLHTSVFSNPFAAAEMAKAAILEKHVKMNTIVKYIGNDCKVPGKNTSQMINGKKICWNYRKGRCRFGHNCKYAHDSDIQKSTEEIEAENQKLNTIVCEGTGTMSSAPPPNICLDNISSTDDTIWEGGSDKRKLKRPGLSQNLVPGKKVAKMYKELKVKDKHRK